MALVDKKLTELTEILSVPDNAFIHVVDPNDVSQSPQGSSYKAKKSTIGGAVKAQVTVSGTVKTNINNADPIVYLKGSVDDLLSDKQDTLVNGINIASINSQNLLNGGNIEIANTIPTLQEVLENNHDLVGGNNFQGTDAGNVNSGNNVNAFGINSAFNNSGSFVNALGNSSAQNNTAPNVNAMGNGSAFNNSGSYVNAIGNGSAQNNTFNNVNLFGQNVTADENGQTVFGKTNTIFARLSTLLLTATRKYILPNQSGTIALESYVDAIPNPTTNFLPKKGASGFVDSLISESGTNLIIGNPSLGHFLFTRFGDISSKYDNSTRLQFAQNHIDSFGAGYGLNANGGFRIGNGFTFSYITASGTDLILQAIEGRVGIGTTTPTEALDVNGSIKLSNLLKLGQFTTATEPAYVKGASFFNTTLNKMRIGGATAYETVTSS
jgi:hypothetical protein